MKKSKQNIGYFYKKSTFFCIAIDLNALLASLIPLGEGLGVVVFYEGVEESPSKVNTEPTPVLLR